MNNVKLKIAVLSVAMFGMMSGVANSASMEGDSSVKIVKGISIKPYGKAVDGVQGSGHSDLYFGKVVSPAAGSATLTVGPKGKYTTTGTAVLERGHPATFQISGVADTTMSIEIDKETVMSFGDIALTASLTQSNKKVNTNDAGLAYFTVGGNLTIAKNQIAGEYTGTFNVTANY